MRFIYDNIVTVAIAIFSCTFAWLFGGTYGDVLTPIVPWLWVILAEVMFCFPQRHTGETTYEARERVWHDMKKDPLVWTSIAFILLLLIPLLNVGLCPNCDYKEILAAFESQTAIESYEEFAKIYARPTLPFLPSCVNRLAHMNVLFWFVPSLTMLIAAKHSLLKRGQRLLLRMIVVNGVLLAFIGALQQVTGAIAPLWQDSPLWQSYTAGKGTYFFSTFGYTNMGGDYFTTLFALSVALWRWDADSLRRERKMKDVSSSSGKTHHDFWRKHIMAVPAVLMFFSAMMTLSRAAIMLVSSLAILFFIHALCCHIVRLSRAQRVRSSAIGALGLVVITVFVIAFMPEDVKKETDTIGTTEVLDRLTGRGQYHVRVASVLWKDYFLFGCGGWGYKHLCMQRMTPDELKQLQKVGGINVHNDHLQFLAEHGTIGYGMLVAIVVMLIIPLIRVWKALMSVIRFTPPKEQPPKPASIFVIPAPVFCILMGALATIIHAFGDCPLRSPAVLSLFFISLACMNGFLPRLREE